MIPRPAMKRIQIRMPNIVNEGEAARIERSQAKILRELVAANGFFWSQGEIAHGIIKEGFVSRGKKMLMEIEQISRRIPGNFRCKKRTKAVSGRYETVPKGVLIGLVNAPFNHMHARGRKTMLMKTIPLLLRVPPNSDTLVVRLKGAAPITEPPFHSANSPY